MKKFIYCAFILSLLGCSSHSVDELKPFTSDGCSSFPDGTLSQQQLWHSCCLAHDKAYWIGGTYQQRRSADHALKACVEQVGEPQIASLMLAGVRVGGSPYWPTSYRWGYGWDFLRGYQVLTAEEKARAEKLLALYEDYQKKLNDLAAENKQAN